MDSPLVKALRRFIRKERFWLLSDAVGSPFASLSPTFLSKLGSAIGIKIPSDPWWAFDYHFDWLHAALTLGPEYCLDPLPGLAVNTPRVATGGQQDIDLLVAFEQTIVLIEAKLSTSWTNKQMQSKSKRIFALPVQNVRPYFVLSSPSKPKNLKLTDLPPWALKARDKTPHHIILPGNEDQDRNIMVSRCNACGDKDKNGRYWRMFEA